MNRRTFAQAFKPEAVTLKTVREVALAQASRELGVRGAVLRNCPDCVMCSFLD